MRYISILLVLFIAACSSSGEKSSNDTTKMEISEKFLVDTAASAVKWERYNKSKNTNTNFSLGKLNIDLNVSDAEVTTNGSFVVKSGEWTLKDKTSITGLIIVDLTKCASVKVGKDNKLEMAAPDYLNIEKYPTAKLEFTSLKLNCDSCDVDAKLTIKDTTGAIKFPSKIKWENSAPKEFKAKFTIDGRQWGLVNKKASGTVVEDRLTFDCDIKSATKPASIMRKTDTK